MPPIRLLIQLSIRRLFLFCLHQNRTPYHHSNSRMRHGRVLMGWCWLITLSLKLHSAANFNDVQQCMHCSGLAQFRTSFISWFQIFSHFPVCGIWMKEIRNNDVFQIEDNQSIIVPPHNMRKSICYGFWF